MKRKRRKNRSAFLEGFLDPFGTKALARIGARQDRLYEENVRLKAENFDLRIRLGDPIPEDGTLRVGEVVTLLRAVEKIDDKKG